MLLVDILTGVISVCLENFLILVPDPPSTRVIPHRHYHAYLVIEKLLFPETDFWRDNYLKSLDWKSWKSPIFTTIIYLETESVAPSIPNIHSYSKEGAARAPIVSFTSPIPMHTNEVPSVSSTFPFGYTTSGFVPCLACLYIRETFLTLVR